MELKQETRPNFVLDLAEKRVNTPIDVEDVVRYINLYQFAYGVRPEKIIVNREQFNHLIEDFKIWRNIIFGKTDLEPVFKRVLDIELEVRA